MSYFNTAKAFLLRYKWYVLGVIVLGIGLIGYAFNGDGESPAADSGPREVRVARVSDLMNDVNSLSVVAEITSVSEAKISAESAGRIARVNAELGDRVSAGTVLAEIENSSQRAAVLQAEGALDAARASAGGSQESAVSTLLGAYGAVNTAIEDAVGQIYTNPESSQGGFSVSTRDTQALAAMEASRNRMSDIVRRQDAQVGAVGAGGATAELATLEGELREVRVYLDIVLRVLNAAVPREDVTATTISGYVADVTASRAAITTSLTAVISARTALESGGGTLSSSAAAIKQAEGSYQAALANLNKTIIRSPISGTLNNFTVKLGDFVSVTQQVAIVSNNGALEAVAYVTEEDRGRITVGQKVRLGETTGTITKIAPALDPVTRRVEVRIGLPAKTTLTNGQSVRVELSENSVTTPAQGPLSIPITALKIEANRTIVFGVENGTVVAHEITIGKLSGSTVQVLAGLTAESEIVADVRGLKEGDEVSTGARD